MLAPSSGSRATSNSGPSPPPIRSPVNSKGVSSCSPWPITTLPQNETASNPRRMASTAACSAALALPRPIQRAEDKAAASVTRTTSSARLRSTAPPSPDSSRRIREESGLT